MIRLMVITNFHSRGRLTNDGEVHAVGGGEEVALVATLIGEEYIIDGQPVGACDVVLSGVGRVGVRGDQTGCRTHL